MELDASTRGLLSLVLLPPGILILLLLLGWLFARRLFGRLLILVALLGLYLLSTPMGLDWLAGRIETIPPPSPEQLRQSGADAILVFMADVRRDNPELGGAPALSDLSLARIDHALALHRRTGLPIVVSGGIPRGETRPLAEIGADWLADRAQVTALALETTSRDTWENAHHSAELLQARGLGRVLLVTHAYHMPRAMVSARAAGIDAIPAPFAFQHSPTGAPGDRRDTDWLPHPGYLGRSYLVLHEMLGMVWYGLGPR